MKQSGILFLFIIIHTAIFALFFTLDTARASSNEIVSQRARQSDTPLLQTTVTPTLTSTAGNLSTYNLTLNDLGYREITLDSPLDQEIFTFRVPLNWELKENSFIELDLSYHFSSLDTKNELPMTFGDLHITLDDQTLEIFSIPSPDLDHYLLRVPIPPSLLGGFNQKSHTLELTFDASFFCAIPHNATLIVHPTSFLALTYSLSSLNLDLSTYPLPFYQRSFEPEAVIFGLPTQPSAAEASGVVSLAAKLGDLTRNQMVISATTDLDLINSLSSATTLAPHLFVIGQPQNNRLLPLLNQMADLPIPLKERQLELITQGPVLVSPNQVFTYTFKVTNTSDQPAALSLIDSLPTLTEFVECQPQCVEDKTAGTLTWSEAAFAPGENKNFFLVLRASKTITNPYLENTATLVEAQAGPINGDSLVSQVSLNDQDHAEQQTSAANKGDYFFVFNGKAVAEDDGIIQEIISPWNKDRAILIVTGLNDKAIKKASWAMSSEARFPGMIGPAALVQDASPPEIDTVLTPTLQMSFKDLGYDDKVLRGRFSKKTSYSFFLPVGWQLTDNAVLNLSFSHAEIPEDTNAGVTVILNDTPIATIVLSNETAANNNRQIQLLASAARSGEQNRLTIQSIPAGGGGERCKSDALRDFWLVIKSESGLLLDHTQDENKLDLSRYPYPFSNHPSLIDLLFALPAAPNNNDWEIALRLASSLGNAASGRTILPTVTLGDSYHRIDLENYHIIAFGRPTRNPLIQQANSNLPQPFLANSDQVQQQIDGFIFRLPPDTALGYLQLIPSPWRAERAFLVVTGTHDQSVTEAAQVLFSGRFKQLNGNLTLIRGENINTLNSDSLLSNEVSPTTYQ